MHLTPNTFSRYLIFLLICALFIYLRFFNLSTSLNFFGDLGRDFLVMQQWQTTGKPPLLGPQTSAMSFNQSAIYFYLLYPFYLITQGSVYATIIAATVYYLLFFTLIFLKYKSNFKLQWQIIGLFLITTVWPGLVRQGRDVWNPTFVPLVILMAFFSWLHWRQQRTSNLYLFLICLALASSIAFSYGSFPVVICFFAIMFFTLAHQDKLKAVLYFLLSLFIVNFPTLVFELRHGFLLTSRIFANQGVHFASNITTAITNFFQYLFYLDWPIGLGLLLLIILAGLKFSQFLPLKITKNISESQLLLITLVSSTVLLWLMPFPLFEHYLPATIALLSLLLVFTPKVGSWLVIALSIWFLQPQFIASYGRATAISIQAKRNCIAQLCQTVTSPVYLNLNSGSHNHQAYEYVYLANQAGCQAVTVENAVIAQPEYMAVISENTQFDLAQTDYYELSLFQPRIFSQEIICQDNLSINIFQKN